MSNFGPHLMVDIKTTSPKIGDLEFVFNFLNTLPEKIGMTKITQPYVFPYSGLIPEDRGITGVVIIAESHISFHSFIEKNYLFFDIFSCKPFDIEKFKTILEQTFDIQNVEYFYQERGKEFPR